MSLPHLQLRGIIKDFSGVLALKGVGLDLDQGMGLGLVGENGAGKSTLMKILSGVYPHGTYQGKILFQGEEVFFQTPKDAEKKGIIIIHQELNLFPELSVGENIFLSHLPTKKWGPIRYSEIKEKTQRLLEQLEVSFSSEDKVGTLSPGEQQMVEIAKALSQDARVLILDEPTSSLTQKEVTLLIGLLRKLQKGGLSFIYISHKLDEIFSLCQRISVLRDGESVFQGETKDMNTGQLVELMVGRKIHSLFPARDEERLEKKPLLEVKDWWAYKTTEKAYRVKGINFQAYAGEILGIAGMMGSGRSDLLLSLMGHEKYRTRGEIRMDGQKLSFSSPREAMKNGIVMVSEDRKKSGLHLEQSVTFNMNLPWPGLPRPEGVMRGGRLQHQRIKNLVESLVKKFHIKVSSLDQKVKTLSGGNQQKITMAKVVATGPRVLFLDEPTRGVDVGAKGEIYSLLGELVQEGLLIVMVSSELPEILGLCHRVLVIKDGQLVRTLAGDEKKETNIIKASLGV